MKSEKKPPQGRIAKTPKSFANMTIDELRKLSFAALFGLFGREVRMTFTVKKSKPTKGKKAATMKSRGRQLREVVKRILTPGPVTYDIPEATTNEETVVEGKATEKEKQSETVVFSRNEKKDSE